jgi:hypothetical protein
MKVSMRSFKVIERHSKFPKLHFEFRNHHSLNIFKATFGGANLFKTKWFLAHEKGFNSHEIELGFQKEDFPHNYVHLKNKNTNCPKHGSQPFKQ